MIGFSGILLVLCTSPLLIESIHVPCELKWISEGYGNIPSASIEGGSKEYIARAYHNDKWIPGRVSTSKGRIFITSEGTSVEYDTYEVLTNPGKCLLEWVDGYGGSAIPEAAVSVNSLTDPEILIGHGIVAGMTLGGRVDISQGAIFISYEGREEMRRSYQILRSYYPPLKVRMSKFVFTNLDFEGRNKTELIGQEDLRNTFNSEILHNIDHSKIIQERFTLTEENDWEGFSSIDFSFPLWYGSSDITGHFELNPIEQEETELTVYRDKEVKVKRDLTVKAAGATSPSHIQVCSTVSIIEDLVAPISFTAQATYEAENMTREQVQKILEALKRPIRSTKAAKKSTVTGEISGTLNGRFALHVSSYTSPAVVNYKDICTGYVDPAKLPAY